MGLENNKCEHCEGTGTSDNYSPGLEHSCGACKGTGKKQKAEAPPEAVVDVEKEQCSGNIETCQLHGGECGFCGERDCPVGDPFHYHHDGCPSCGGAYEITLEQYSEASRANAVYPGRGSNVGLAYAGLGLAGESGEVCDKLKKILRDKGGEISGEDQKKICLELGDALWYLDAVAFECGLTLEQVAAANLKKLADRRARKVIHGEGDNR